VTAIDNGLHEALCFAGRLRPQHLARPQPRDAGEDTLTFRVTFAQSHVGEWRIGEHAIWNQPIARAAVPTGQIVPDDLKVVAGDMRELRATGTFPERPDLGRTRLQPLIHANVAATVQLNASLLKPDPGGVRNTPHRDQNIAALDVLVA